MLDVSGFNLGLAFFDLVTVLPLLMQRLGAHGELIGQFATVRSLCFNFVQVFVAYAVHSKAHQKPILAWIATLMRLPLLFLPWFLSQAGTSEAARQTAMWATILIFSLWALGDGLGYISWMEIVSRAFPHRTRGRFFTATQLVSGLANIGIAGLIVQNVLGSSFLPYPKDYMFLAIALAVFMQISLVGIFLIKEPPIPQYARNPKPRPPLLAYFKRIPGMVRSNPIFLRLSIVQLLIGFGVAAQPFYVLYATQHFGLSDRWGGRYQVYSAIGMIALMPLWTWLSERRSAGAAVRGVAIACLLTPICAYTIGTLSPWLFGVVFLLMGGSLGWGMWIVLNQFLLTHVEEEERPIFVALINLIFAPSAFYPTLGGMLVPKQAFVSVQGVPVLFLITTAVVALGCLLALRLPDPEPAAK